MDGISRFVVCFEAFAVRTSIYYMYTQLVCMR